MSNLHTRHRNLVVALLVLVVAAGLAPSAILAQAAPQQAPAAAPAQAPAPAPAATPAPQPQSACGNQALCYEANDFTATITSFRTSLQGYLRIIDIVMRFQNKTNSPITLGYVGNSGTATDDRGNRYGVWGPNGFRGIGLVSGNTFDPRFSLRAGGFGDAQFELAWNPGQTVYGLTFQVDLTVDEINTVEGNQHTLGGEFPLHFVGLANGAGAASPAVTNLIPATGGGGAGAANPVAAAAANPSAAANTVAAAAANPSAAAAPAAAGATQAACNTANQSGAATAATNVANAVNSIGSLFGKKKPAQNTTQNSNSSGPCDPANNNSQAPAAGAAQAPAANTANPAGAKPAAKTTGPGK